VGDVLSIGRITVYRGWNESDQLGTLAVRMNIAEQAVNQWSLVQTGDTGF